MIVAIQLEETAPLLESAGMYTTAILQHNIIILKKHVAAYQAGVEVNVTNAFRQVQTVVSCKP